MTSMLFGWLQQHCCFEVSRADFEIVDSERKAIESAIQRVFSLTEKETCELADLAEQEVEHSVSLYEFTDLINQHFSSGEKVRMIEMLWQVVFADSQLASYEEAVVRKIAELIYVPHREFIQAKHRVENAISRA